MKRQIITDVMWQNDETEWKGTNGKEFQEMRNRYVERKKTSGRR